MFRQVLALTLLVAVSNIEGRSHRRVFANPILRTLYNNFPRNAAKTCNKPVDLGFALDKTGQYSNDNFTFAKTFAKALISKFEISDKATHIGAVAFDNKAQILLLFNDLKGSKNNLQSVREQIDSWGPGSPGAKPDLISEGLKYSDDFLFTEGNGMRSGVEKVLIVLTDGKQDQDQEAMQNNAQDLRNNKEVKIFPIGIGQLDPIELLKMAGFQNAGNVRKLDNEGMIEKEATEVAKLICQ